MLLQLFCFWFDGLVLFILVLTITTEISGEQKRSLDPWLGGSVSGALSFIAKWLEAPSPVRGHT